jgi:hypothetical protein
LIRGDIGAIHHPFEMTDEQIAAYEVELREKASKRRPADFTASWPAEQT